MRTWKRGSQGGESSAESIIREATPSRAEGYARSGLGGEKNTTTKLSGSTARELSRSDISRMVNLVVGLGVLQLSPPLRSYKVSSISGAEGLGLFEVTMWRCLPSAPAVRVALVVADSVGDGASENLR
ncbi:hypothetical protein B0H16DRAFT_1447176 [Mycena metata]|uniref:Uncharacterized protein n=1 Tax=Mycena metata TaxID=1033252 RepID=A0AAD7KEG9_9AGAR|nr:hypothetical protein B0H16DRAFT_1447176 [Mycena metata]